MSRDAETPTTPQEIFENDHLLDAISGGEVDAFLVGKDDKEKRVLLLAGAYQRYRQLVEQMQQGAVTCSMQGDILYANHRFADMIGVPLSQLYAAPLDGYVSAPDRARLASFLLVSARMSSIEIVFTRRDGLSLPTRLELVNFADGYATMLVTALGAQQWAGVAEDALNIMRTAVESLNRAAISDGQAKRSIELLAREINGLGRLVDEIRGTPGPRG
ncbi:MAG TPA: PAS domain-containing protein [Burkholderiales bacterium]|nr:PAS domain-containing protein [Burkholderiales bacterium]